MTRPTASLILLGLTLWLSACQSQSVLSTEQRVQLALGVAQSARPDGAESLLQAANADYVAANDALGDARTLFALGELYKSKPWQDRQVPPNTLNSYLKSADFYARAAVRYQQLQKPALEAAAHVGEANAYLLADQLPKACATFALAQDIATDPRINDDPTSAAQLTRSMRFFADLTVVCLTQPH
ncbi:MAG: hypothetical protein RLY58_378 [Pseudomonadota bacterium]|jgi:hypothetical protein